MWVAAGISSLSAVELEIHLGVNLPPSIAMNVCKNTVAIAGLIFYIFNRFSSHWAKTWRPHEISSIFFLFCSSWFVFFRGRHIRAKFRVHRSRDSLEIGAGEKKQSNRKVYITAFCKKKVINNRSLIQFYIRGLASAMEGLGVSHEICRVDLTAHFTSGCLVVYKSNISSYCPQHGQNHADISLIKQNDLLEHIKMFQHIITNNYTNETLHPMMISFNRT